MRHNSNVPAFLAKLWTLVEDADTNEFICWSQEGNSFLVLDEQRFAKEILPKFFKHNNMASFIRQLNMYGFRKVMHVDTGIVKQERDGPVEFQHHYFKHGQDELLENIKRKVSNARPEDGKMRPDDLTNILASVQSFHSKHENIETRLATLKRENEALWREISDLRQKHAHQQQLIKKLIQFIVTLVQNNHIMNLKRKRPILLNSSGKKPKYIHQIYDDNTCVEQSAVNSLNGVKSSEVSDDVIICDLTENDGDVMVEIAEGSPPRTFDQDVEIVELELDGCEVCLTDAEESPSCADTRQTCEGQRSSGDPDGSGPTSSALQCNNASSLSVDDPVKIMDSILNENGAISQNINLLGKMELMDYLDSIDCSLEDFQTMLYGKHFDIDFDALQESMPSKENTTQPNKGKAEEDNTDKQLIQYTTCPLLAFIDGCTPPAELDPSASSGSSFSPTAQADTAELLESRPSVRSSLIRLEPLTEAQACEETLFNMCELSPPAGLDFDSNPLDRLCECLLTSRNWKEFERSVL